MNAIITWFRRHFATQNAAPHLYGSLIGGKGQITIVTNVSVGLTAVQVLALNTSRRVALISNNGAALIYLGKDNTVTTANGMNLAIGAALTDTEAGGAWWAISGTAAQDVRLIEIS